MKTIVITGGPCSGKTTAICALQERLWQAGIHTICVKEAGTDLILSGISPTSSGSMTQFQTRVAALQIERETAACREAFVWEANPKNNTEASPRQNSEILIMCDRGICDGKAYVPPQDYTLVLEANNLTAAEALERYDAVFCLESTASLEAGMYTRDNNSARSETPEEAIALDQRTKAAWEDHPHFTFIENEETFEAKLEQLLKAVLAFWDSCSKEPQ